MTQHPAEREAERLRIILMAFAEAQPYMKLEDAIPSILAAEKRTRDLEAVQFVPEPTAPGMLTVPDMDPQTIAAWIDLTPSVSHLLRDGKKVQAIRDIRIHVVTPVGAGPSLYEAKTGAEFWMSSRMAPSPSGRSAVVSGRSTIANIAKWIDEPSQKDIRDLMYDRKKILAIKEVRNRYGASLMEAKDGVEYWEKT